jgi:hypothetical protein
MLHWWLIPLILAACLLLWGFYLLLRREGGSGERTTGRTLVDKPDEAPPQE